MKSITKTIALVAISMLGLSGWAQGVQIEQLAGDHSLIRIDAKETSKYLMLPIEEKAPEARIVVVANLKQDQVINVRLAQGHVDYYVPFCLEQYHGKDLALQVNMNINRSNRGGATEVICWNNIRLSNNFDTTNVEKFRPAYHHTPVYAWMNDPNGMFYLNGEWHLFYQWGPYGSMWNNMNWGHSVSRDLIHWEHRPTALSPDAFGTIFSGSCVVDKDNTAGFGKNAVIALYTSAQQTPGGDIQSQSLAYSTDGGNTFTKYTGNPILTADIHDFRDPNMFWNEETKEWNLVLACGQEMRFYSSPNLINWKEESRFGHGYGCHAGVWECPDLMKLPVEGTKESKWVLLCNINPGGPMGGSATQYFIGDWDGHKFTCMDAPEVSKWQDYGKDHYATVSFSNAPDNRHTVIAWMSNWEYANEVPTKQFRSGNSIAREPFLYKTKNGIFLGSRPSPEYDGKGLDQTIKIKGSCTITLSNDEGEEYVLVYDQKAMTLSADRSRSGITDFNQNFCSNNGVVTAPLQKKLTSIRFFVDNCSVEAFGNNGEVCITNLVFPKSKFNHITVK